MKICGRLEVNFWEIIDDSEEKILQMIEFN